MHIHIQVHKTNHQKVHKVQDMYKRCTQGQTFHICLPASATTCISCTYLVHACVSTKKQ